LRHADGALVIAEERLNSKPEESSGDGVRPSPLASLEMAVEQQAALNLALISVLGDYAAAEAIKALRPGLSVMLFSDNVSLAHEREIKTLAREKNLLVMGPDCGTAIINGMPLGFANVVRRGAIGVVAASGTGLQEVTCCIDQLGAGISQALGTGGHDLHESIGGISMLYGLDALSADPDTRVIVLISKPPAPAVAEKILARARAAGKPVVVNFLGARPEDMNVPGITPAYTLADARGRPHPMRSTLLGRAVKAFSLHRFFVAKDQEMTRRHAQWLIVIKRLANLSKPPAPKAATRH
jgi:FdrA protein